MSKAKLFILLGVAAMTGCQPHNRGPSAAGNGATLQPVQPSTQPAIYEIAPAAARPASGRAEVVRNGSTSLSQSLVGCDCRVQFRRDALGMAGAAPIGATQEWSGRVAVSGRVLELTDQWLVIQPPETGRRFYIPVGSILLIDVKD